MKRNRDKAIDYLKGFGIFLMIFDHVCSTKISHIYIQAFHMPLFFIVSGYLYKKRSIKESIVKNFKKLIIPYLVFSLLFIIIILINMKYYDVKNVLLSYLIWPTKIHNYAIGGALWFLPCMFLAEVVYSIFQNGIKNEKIRKMIILLLAIASFAYSYFFKFELPFCIQPMLVSLLFIEIGYSLRKYKKLLNLSPIKIFLLLCAVSALFFVNKSVDMRSARFNNPILYVINGTFGTIAFWNIMNVIKDKSNRILDLIKKVFEYLSINAMIFICSNQAIILLLESIFSVDSRPIVQKIICKIGIFIVTIGLCCLFDNVIKKVKNKIINSSLLQKKN